MKRVKESKLYFMKRMTSLNSPTGFHVDWARQEGELDLHIPRLECESHSATCMDADLTSYSLRTHRYKTQTDKWYRIKQPPISPHNHIFHHHHCHPRTNLWSWYPGGSVCVAPWWSEVRKVRVQAGPLASAPAGILRWLLGPPQDRRREPLRSRPPDLHSAWSRLHKTSDRHRVGHQCSESMHAAVFTWVCSLCDPDGEKTIDATDGWHLSCVSRSLRCCY